MTNNYHRTVNVVLTSIAIAVSGYMIGHSTGRGFMTRIECYSERNSINNALLNASTNPFLNEENVRDISNKIVNFSWHHPTGMRTVKIADTLLVKRLNYIADNFPNYSTSSEAPSLKTEYIEKVQPELKDIAEDFDRCLPEIVNHEVNPKHASAIPWFLGVVAGTINLVFAARNKKEED